MKEIPLTKGYVALVDDDDVELLAPYRWSAQVGENSNTVYAVRCYPKRLSMHSVIMGEDPLGRTVDHKDRNGLNNQRSNLRFADKTQQQLNKPKAKPGVSQYKGVYRERSKWAVRTRLYGKRYFLGYFDTEIDAAKAYDAFATVHHGEFAVLNIPPE